MLRWRSQRLRAAVQRPSARLLSPMRGSQVGPWRQLGSTPLRISMVDFERNAAAKSLIHKIRLPLLLCTALVLNACVAGLAVSALGAAAQSGQARSESNEHLGPAAEQSCSAHASQFGTVRVIDVEQRTMSKLVVWGTTTSGASRQSFECIFTTKVVAFKLRPIKT